MAHLNSPRRTPKVCPVCGEDVPPRALACPECGADHKSGWREGALDEDGLGLPEEEFDYEEFVREEFAGKEKAAIHPLWWAAALVLLIVMAIGIYFGAF